MDDLTHLEQKRLEASRYRGVSYDARMGKFVAMITINGEKKYLGSFLAAEDASFAYDTERAAHKIDRKRTGSAKSLRQLMAEFAENAQYNNDRYKNAVAGQIFTAPDGQRFRIEGFKADRGKGWYLWSAPCRFCGARFEQETSLKLRNITGMSRNCEQHHKMVHKPVDAPDVWPDPVEWGEAPQRIQTAAGQQRTKKTAEFTQHMFEKHLDYVWVRLEGDKALEAEFVKVEAKLRDFFSDHALRFPDSDYDAKFGAWMAQRPEPFAELLENKRSSTPNARLEDLEILAADPPTDNSDLLG